MKRTMTAAVFAAAVLLLPAAAFAADYDLAAYLQKVERDNKDLALSRAGLDGAQQSVAMARSALLPSVGSQIGYTRTLSGGSGTVIGVDTTTPMIPGSNIYPAVTVGPFDNEVTVGVGVTQKIIDSESVARYQQAKTGRALQSQALEATRRGLRTGAKKLYAQAQLADAVVEVMATSEKTAEDTYRDLARKYKVGIAKELDMLMAEVEYKSRIPKTMEARKNAQIAMMALKNLAGIPLSEPVKLTEAFTELPELPVQVELGNALAARPDYSIELLSRDLADIARKASLASFLPTLSATYTYGWAGYGDGGEYKTYTGKQTTFGLNLTVPLFTGGYRLALMEQAKIEQRKAALNLSQKKDDVEQELQSLRLTMETAKGSLDTAVLVAETAQRAYNLAKSAYDTGLATQLSVTNASTNLDQARLGVLNARFEYRAAYYDWAQATGSRD